MCHVNQRCCMPTSLPPGCDSTPYLHHVFGTVDPATRTRRSGTPRRRAERGRYGTTEPSRIRCENGRVDGALPSRRVAVGYLPSEQQITAMFRLVYRRQAQFLACIGVGITAILGGIAALALDAALGNAVILIGVADVLLVLIAFEMAARRSANRFVEKQKRRGWTPVRFEFSTGGFESQSPREDFVPWSSYAWMQERRNFFVLWNRQRRGPFMIPKSAFRFPEDQTAFEDLARRHVATRKRSLGWWPF